MADYRQEPVFGIIIGQFSAAFTFVTREFSLSVILLKVESSYMVSKTYYRIILSCFKQILHLEVGNKDLME